MPRHFLLYIFVGILLFLGGENVNIYVGFQRLQTRVGLRLVEGTIVFCDEMEHQCPPFSRLEPHYLREDLLDCMRKVVVNEGLLSFCATTCKGCVDCTGIHEIKDMLKYSSSINSGIGSQDYISRMQDSYTMSTTRLDSGTSLGE